MTGLIRLGAVGAILGGALRIVAAFIPYDPALGWLELLYGVIDIGLLFGLIALYLAHSDKLGVGGLALFALALAALASIIGPDSRAFGTDWYLLGAGVFLAALAGLGLLMLWQGLARGPAACWIFAFIIGLLTLSGGASWAFVASGVSLGLGFVLVGQALLSRNGDRSKVDV
jgi:hypothetical protein